MNRIPAKNRHREMAELLLMLLLLCAFAVSALVLVMIGGRVYKTVTTDMENNYELRIPLSYVSNKIRQSDRESSIQVLEKEGTPVLILSSNDNGIALETWIYEYEGQLFELYHEPDSGLGLGDGIAVLPVHAFDMEMDGQRMLKLTSHDASGRALSLSLALRSDTKEAE